MCILTVAVITLCADLVFAQYSPCLSANGRRRECIPFDQCEQLVSLAKKPDRTDQDTKLLHRSSCGFRGNVAHVCCPEPNIGQRINSPPCSTPDGKPGECISLFSCPHLKNLLQPPVPQEVISFVQSYRCFGPEEHSVCCGSPPTIPRNTTPRNTNPRTTTPPDSDTVENPAKPADCPALMTAFPPARSTKCCGISATSSKIIGGTTGIDEHPWAVIIEYSSKESQQINLSCGGALISGKYVLTAAHCIAGRILEIALPTTVRLGEYDTSHDGKDCDLPRWFVDGEECTEGEIRIRIEKTIPHPNIIWRSEHHDIGLIRMRDTAPYTDFIRPICLPSKDLTQPENTPPNFSMYAVGWGLQEGATHSAVKQWVNLRFVSLEKCQSMLNTSGRIEPLWKGQLCAGGVEDMDVCKGDSGGSLVHRTQETFEVIGIDSFGRSCKKDDPEIYTNVYEYLDWIKNVIVA